LFLGNGNTGLDRCLNRYTFNALLAHLGLFINDTGFKLVPVEFINPSEYDDKYELVFELNEVSAAYLDLSCANLFLTGQIYVGQTPLV
jgi:hypothetical protein